MNDPITTLAADLIALVLGADAATLPQERRAAVEAKLREAMGVTYAGACEQLPATAADFQYVRTAWDDFAGHCCPT